MLAKLASSHSHLLLAKLIDLGAAPPSEEVVTVARCETFGLQVVVSITRYDGPARFFPAIPASQVPPKCPSMTPLQAAIAGLLSKDKPAKAEWLAMKLGKKCGGSFRSLCADVVRLGVARHVKGLGYLAA